MTGPGLPSQVSPYPRMEFEFFCPFDMRLKKARSFPILESLLTHYGMAIQAIYAKLDCNPAGTDSGFDTVTEAIDYLLGVAAPGSKQMSRVMSQNHKTGKTSFQTVEVMTYDFGELPTTGRLIWDHSAVPVGPDTAEVRLFNLTDGISLGGLAGISTTGTKTATLTVPTTGAKTLLLQHRVTGGTSTIRGASVHLGV